MKIDFVYDREKDVWCLLNKGKSSINSQSATESYKKLVEVKGENPTSEDTSDFISKYITENQINIEQLIKQYEMDWEKVEGGYHKKAEEIFGATIPSGITAYLTINNRCPYSIDENYFFVSMSSVSVRKTIMHELFHFYTWYAFPELAKNVSKEKYNDIKESLTVLLNVEFADLINGDKDHGYPQHQDIRNRITSLWSQEKNLKSIIQQLS